MAGMDNTLLALAGSGYSGKHAFGFASCERAVGASEGINVLMQREVPGSDGELQSLADLLRKRQPQWISLLQQTSGSRPVWGT
jgi:hypothetical protein